MKKIKENLFVKHLSNWWNVFFQDVIKWFLKLIPFVVLSWFLIEIYGGLDSVSDKLLNIFQIHKLFPNTDIISILKICIGISIIVFVSYAFHHFTRMNFRLLDFIEKKIEDVPLAWPVYKWIKDFSGLLFNKKKWQKWLVVLTNTYGWDGYSIGIVYLTEDVLLNNYANVYIPSSPTPTSGMNFIVNKKKIYVLEWITLTDATTYIFSLGINKIDSFFRNLKEIDELTTLEEFLRK